MNQHLQVVENSTQQVVYVNRDICLPLRRGDRIMNALNAITRKQG
jgi:hypothetical protein